MPEISQQDLDAALRRVAAAAASEVAAVAAAAAKQVAATASEAASALAENTRIDLQYIKRDLAEIKLKLESKYVTTEAFDPIRRIVYGLVGLVLTGAAAAVLRGIWVK